MNEQQFAAIQKRWSDASGGPWTVEAAWTRPAQDDDEGEPMSEEDFAFEAMQRCRMVYAMPPKMVEGRRRVVDRKIGMTDVEEPAPTFFVTAEAKAADLVFVRQATEDMGQLLQAVEDQRDEIDRLKGELLEAKARAKQALERADVCSYAVQSLQRAAARLLEIQT